MQICINIYSILLYLMITYLIGAGLYFSKARQGVITGESMLYFIISPIYVIIVLLYATTRWLFPKNFN